MGSSLNPAGIKKPSPGFILKADASLAPLNNAQIEVRAMSGARAPSRFPPSTRRSRGVSKRRLSREKRRFSRAIRSIFLKGEKAPVQTTAGWFTVGRPTRRFQTFFVFFLFRVCSFSSLAQKASGSRAGPTLTVHKTPFEFAAPPSFPSLTSCIGPTTACGTKLRLCL